MRFLDLTSAPASSLTRSSEQDEPIEAVRAIIAEVKAHGDKALRSLTARFDGCTIDQLRVSEDEIDEAHSAASPELIAALEEAAGRIEGFASNQKMQPWESEIGGGVVGEHVSPLPSAGAYVPGGRATYPSSVLMTAVPARVAGVRRFAMCVPPASDGGVPKPTLAAAKVAGVREIYRVGGAQAIAAMAFGTESIPKVEVIVGPGNIYVALAKREVAGMVAIDSVAGPSEIVIVADASADPRLIAWDLVAQAEHGPNGAFAVVTWDRGLAERIPGEVAAVLESIEAPEMLRETLQTGTTVALVASVDEAIRVVEEFAPEHLELVFEGAQEQSRSFTTAGAIFIGPWSPVSLGDYLAGSNHVLPTAGAARWASGLRASHFQRATAFIRHSQASLRKASVHVQALAAAEGLPIHSGAVMARFKEE